MATTGLSGQRHGLASLQELRLYNDQFGGAAGVDGRAGDLARYTCATTGRAALPDAIGKLAQLRHLDLCDNLLAALPDALGDLAALEYLDLRNNRLYSLPQSIGDLGTLITSICARTGWWRCPIVCRI